MSKARAKVAKTVSAKSTVKATKKVVKAPQGKADAVLTEIIRNGVLAVTEEMKTNLMRTAYNMIIYEALDFTVGLYTAEGETVSIGLGLPSFIRGMSNTIKAKIEHFGDDIQPGDILVTNDAYITGSHLHHFTFSIPIFNQGKLSGWSCCMAHWPDVGGGREAFLGVAQSLWPRTRAGCDPSHHGYFRSCSTGAYPGHSGWGIRGRVLYGR